VHRAPDAQQTRVDLRVGAPAALVLAHDPRDGQARRLRRLQQLEPGVERVREVVDVGHRVVRIG
jgi:hypothetical protein